jgi:predicted Ser/Thr protein kinase
MAMAAHVTRLSREVIDRSREAAALFPRLVTKPSVVLLWLASARASQVALLSLVLGLGLGMPRLLDATLPRLYPDLTIEKKVFGLIPRRVVESDPRRETRRSQVTAVGWGGAGLCVGFLLWLHVPVAMGRAQEAARRREQQADELVSSAPHNSLGLYRASLRLATDPAHESALLGKVVDLERRLGPEADGPHGPVQPGRGGATEWRPLAQTSGGLGSVGPDSRYRLERELGRGGMGVVYLATDQVLDRAVALKELPVRLNGESDLVQRFRHEARVLARLTHPHIVQVYDLFEDQGRSWIAMEYVEGGDLAHWIEEHGRLRVAEAAHIARRIAEAMQLAHDKEIVHRDIKPLNVLLTAEGTPKLADFGIARLVASGPNTVAGTVFGSPEYMSPEQAAGQTVDRRSDVYSLGVTLYEMLTGDVPFQGETAVLLVQQLNAAPPPPGRRVDGLPVDLEVAVLAMLEKDPAQRPADMATVARLLAPFAEGEAAVSLRAAANDEVAGA